MAETKPAPPPPGGGPTPNPDGTLIQYGPNVRMDRGPMQNDGSFQWTVYALEPVTDGIHPIDGIGATTDVAVWMPQGQGNEADARSLCSQLSGIAG